MSKSRNIVLPIEVIANILFSTKDPSVFRNLFTISKMFYEEIQKNYPKRLFHCLNALPMWDICQKTPIRLVTSSYIMFPVKENCPMAYVSKLFVDKHPGLINQHWALLYKGKEIKGGETFKQIKAGNNLLSEPFYFGPAPKKK